MPALSRVDAREVLDARGDPTLEVEAAADTGALGRVIVASSGANSSQVGVVELRDRDGCRYGRRGVRRAVEQVRGEIASAVLGIDLEDQAGLDARLLELDGTPDRSRLGANTLLGVSLAVSQAAASALGVELFEHLHRLWMSRLEPGDQEKFEATGPSLPVPIVDMISGEWNSEGHFDFHGFSIIPAGARSYSEAIEVTATIYRALGEILKEGRLESALVATEGQYAPRLRTDQAAVDRILEAVLSCGLKMGEDACVALDVGASRFFDPTTGKYRLIAISEDELDSTGMIQLLEHWSKQYPIVSIEDGLAAEDWDAWVELTSRLGDSMQIVGNALYMSQQTRIEQGLTRKASNAVLIRPNQLGTLTEILDTVLLVRRQGVRTILAAGIGEAEDTTIADLAVALGVSQLRVGSMARSERVAKYNRLLRIEEWLGGPEGAPFHAWKVPQCDH